ncbi:MAG: dephospho-CoA kinase [Pseudomonadota bacterium]
MTILVIGLTGSIGMGKSTVAGWMRDRGLPVSDSDQIVHDLYEGAAVSAIEAAFPGSTESGRVDRAKLGSMLVADPEKFAVLEDLVHPMVRRAQHQFLSDCVTDGKPAAVLEVPLLFETGGDARVDVTIVVHAAPDVQRDRVLARPSMTEDKLSSILARQLPSSEKARRADFVVDTGGTLAESEAQLDAVVAVLRERKGTVYQRLWQSEDG